MADLRPERRRSRRILRTVPVRIGLGTEELTAESIDLSVAGVYCRVTKRVPVMTKVQIVLILPGGHRGPEPVRVSCAGVVVRAEAAAVPGDNGPPYRIAIFFTELASADRDTLTAFVDESPA
ncbi:MAG: PilZ domain-containing protein [Candidatus Omnitrophica bacterium]|nr:PilZ domain-containing protein [Candidatus Omnitrophota bacterium]